MMETEEQKLANCSNSSITALVPGGVVTTQNISTVIKPKGNSNSLQFVKIQTPELSKKAAEQIRIADETKISKEKIKEVEEEWQNNLSNWKSKRRQHLSHSFDQEPDQQAADNNNDCGTPRKVKTFAEMIEQRAKSGNRLSFHLQRYAETDGHDDNVNTFVDDNNLAEDSHGGGEEVLEARQPSPAPLARLSPEPIPQPPIAQPSPEPMARPSSEHIPQPPPAPIVKPPPAPIVKTNPAPITRPSPAPIVAPPPSPIVKPSPTPIPQPPPAPITKPSPAPIPQPPPPPAPITRPSPGHVAKPSSTPTTRPSPSALKTSPTLIEQAPLPSVIGVKSMLPRRASPVRETHPLLGTISPPVLPDPFPESVTIDPVAIPLPSPSTHRLPEVTPSQRSLPKPNREDRDKTVLSISGKKRCSSCREELGRGAAAFVVESLSLVYHTNCFRCSVCHMNLSNGFRGVDVRVHAGQLHCQNCYSKDGLSYSRV